MKRKIFNPQQEQKEVLISNFVVRLNEFKILMDDIRSSKMEQPEQHYLIQGLRGMGKTTLLLRIKYEVEKDPTLNKWLMPVFLNEETYNISSLSNLWEEIAEYIDGLNIDNVKLIDQFETLQGKPDYANKCFKLLITFLQNHKKKILLLFDNIGEFFFDKLTDKEARRLREILLTSLDIRIIGASAVVLESTYDYTKPFYDFFHIIHLDGLNEEETFLLLQNIQEELPVEQRIDLQKQRGQIETLRILTGGVIRTIVLLDEIIMHDKDGSAINKLSEMLDVITPYYKHRMDDLKPQQQKIMDAIAKNWDAISTGELTEVIKEDGIKQSSKNLSAQLLQLEKNDLIVKKETDTKNHLYQIKERFFNIWYLMRNGNRYDKRRVMWLTKFLEEFYGADGLSAFIEKHLNCIQNEGYDKYAAYVMAEAIADNKYIDIEQQDKLIKETRKILPENLKNELSAYASEKLDDAINAFNSGDYDKSLSILLSISPQTDRALNDIGLNYTMKGDFVKAEEFYIKAIQKDNVGAMYNLGQLYRIHYENIEEALKYYSLAAEKGFVNAMFNVATTYQSIALPDFEKAIRYYKMAIERGDAHSAFNLALLYKVHLNDIENSKYYYIKAIELGEVKAYTNLASIYLIDLKDVKMAESTYLSGIEKNDYRSMYGLSSLYFDVKKNKEEAYRLAKDAFNLSGDTLYELNVIRMLIWNNRIVEATTLFNEILGRYDVLNKFELNIGYLLDFLLIKKQDYFVLNLFNSNSFNLKDRFKPIYYALMTRLKDEYPNEYLKMGEELKKPVEDILKEIHELAKDYA